MKSFLASNHIENQNTIKTLEIGRLHAPSFKRGREREWERERESVCVCVCVWEIERESVCVCETEKDGYRER